MKNNLRNKFIAFLFNIGTMISWFLCTVSAIDLSFIEIYEPLSEIYERIITIFISYIFIALKIEYIKKSDRDIMFQTINAVMPLLYVTLIVFWYHVSYGGGYTVCTSDSEWGIGILSRMNLSRLTGCWILMIVFLVVWTLIVIKTQLFIEIYQKDILSDAKRRRFLKLSAIFVVLLIVFAVLLIKRSVSDILSNGVLSVFALKCYSSSSIFYWGINGIVIVFSKIWKYLC